MASTARSTGRRGRSCSPRCYRSSLALAAQHGIRSIAFPAIGCGVYGYPWEAAVAIAVRECVDGAARHDQIERILFACFEDDMLALYRTALDGLHPGRVR